MFSCGVKSLDEIRIVKKHGIKCIAEKAQSGDLALFSGDGNWSDVVRCLSFSNPWSHVAIFIREPNGELYVLDSDTKGVKCLRFDIYIARYKGYYIGLRSLNVEGLSRKGITEGLMKFREGVVGMHYSDSLTLIHSVHRQNMFDTTDESLYCAQLVIWAYRFVGLLDDDESKPSNNSKLNDFLKRSGRLPYFNGRLRYKRYVMAASLEGQYMGAYYGEK